MNLRTLATLLVPALLASPVQAQFWDYLVNPQVNVTLTHPPGLGVNVTRVAFAPTSGRGAEDLVSACIGDLVATGKVEVLDRGNTEKVLNEQKLSNSGLINEATAVKMGELLGSPVLLFVKVQKLEVKHTPLMTTTPGRTDEKGNYVPGVTTYISKTQADFNASIQAADLATGKIYSQARIAVDPSESNTSTQGRPEYPSDTVVTEKAISLAREQVIHMLLPWTEKRSLVFYDDKDFGMKEAYRRLQLDDAQGALQKSQEALEAARNGKAKPKYLARTNYNLGLCKFILGDYPGALPYLRAAREVDPKHKIYADAEAECLKAKGLAEEVSRVEARSIAPGNDAGRPALASAPQGPQPAAAQPASRTDAAEQRLMKLEELRKKGLISPEDYNAKKAEILKEL